MQDDGNGRPRRVLAIFALCCSGIGSGCGETTGPPRDGPPTAESREAESARVFAIAQNFEKSGKAREASEAYRHVLREYPTTVQGKKAAERIRRIQRGN